MTNNTHAITYPDDRKVDTSDAWQVLWWCRDLGLTKSQLEHAIHAVGTVIEDIRHYLTRQQSPEAGMPATLPASHMASHSRLSRSPF